MLRAPVSALWLAWPIILVDGGAEVPKCTSADGVCVYDDAGNVVSEEPFMPPAPAGAVDENSCYGQTACFSVIIGVVGILIWKLREIKEEGKLAESGQTLPGPATYESKHKFACNTVRILAAAWMALIIFEFGARFIDGVSHLGLHEDITFIYGGVLIGVTGVAVSTSWQLDVDKHPLPRFSIVASALAAVNMMCTWCYMQAADVPRTKAAAAWACVWTAAPAHASLYSNLSITTWGEGSNYMILLMVSVQQLMLSGGSALKIPQGAGSEIPRWNLAAVMIIYVVAACQVVAGRLPLLSPPLLVRPAIACGRVAQVHYLAKFGGSLDQPTSAASTSAAASSTKQQPEPAATSTTQEAQEEAAATEELMKQTSEQLAKLDKVLTACETVLKRDDD
eukprot:TRINITY_DN20224_c0_g2_i9.p1 TRINITY_DN20224_c0_g2~~TRINITY_DN20224_c0_g2_i9.p1  ORF type:complete len:394 (-),score=73.18 TRINITY_DN20224_c0_g2_i9:123-1304(-)